MRAPHLAAVALALTPLAPAQSCGDSFVEGYELLSNTGNWVWSGIFQANIGSGGVPDAYVHSEKLTMVAPVFRSTSDSPYTGDYPALDVTSLGIDLKAFAIDAQACQRFLNLVLVTDSGTPDPTDDLFVFFPSQQVLPCVDGTWHSYTIDVPSQSTVLPVGWRADPASPLSDDATWNAVLADVSSVQWSLGSPFGNHAPTVWQMGADNARVGYSGGASTYCTTKVTSEGCAAAMRWFGVPSVSTGGFTLRVEQVVEGQFGLLFYGFDSAAIPLQDGLLCVAPPLTRTPVQLATGNGQACSGQLQMDFNTVIQSGQDPGLVTGATVFAQYWSRDPAVASGTNLSNGVRFTICP